MRSARWATEPVFVFSALVLGAALPLQWFTSSRWYPHKSTLFEFAVSGGWQANHMSELLLAAPFVMVLLFYAINMLTRRLVRVALSDAVTSQYVKYDKCLYAVFLLPLSGLFGLYIENSVLFVLFLLANAALLVRIGGRTPLAIPAFLTENGRLLALFFCSGFAALIYQIVWQRALFQAFGVNIESVTIIVSIFMSGLGVGSLAGGILSRKYPAHLPHLFVLCETVIGVFGIASLDLIALVTRATLHSSLATVSVATYGLLFVPTLFMGATLPILTTYLYKMYRNVGASISLLYFINTLGSAIACFATAFLLFVYVGLRTSCYVAAAINLLVAFLAYAYVRQGDRDAASSGPGLSHPPAPSARQSRLRYLLMLFVSLTVGFVSLSQEILWVRLASFATGGRATVFPLVLGCFLIGIALGSLHAKRLCERHHEAVLNIVSMFIVVSALSYYLLIPLVSRLIGLIGYAGLPLLFFGIMGIAFLTGAVFPMLSHYAITSGAHVGFSMSWVYCLNIVGATAGSLLTGFFLLEWFTIGTNVLLISIFYSSAGAVLWLFSRRHFPYRRSLLLRCTPSDVAGCRQAVIACDGSVGRSVPSAPYVWNIGMG